MLAAILACAFIGIADADTPRARCDLREGMEKITVRITKMDAPERRQPFGSRST
jgi:endonuclease YncB( thermonuclease family)